MKDRLIAKALAATVLAVVCGWLIAHDAAKWQGLGREAFLAHEAERFDKVIAPTHSLGGLSSGVALLLVVGLYEGAVAVLARLLPQGK